MFQGQEQTELAFCRWQCWVVLNMWCSFDWLRLYKHLCVHGILLICYNEVMHCLTLKTALLPLYYLTSVFHGATKINWLLLTITNNQCILKKTSTKEQRAQTEAQYQQFATDIQVVIDMHNRHRTVCLVYQWNIRLVVEWLDVSLQVV